MAEHLSRKQLKRPDAVLAGLRRWYTWAEDNLHTIIFIGAGLFVAAGFWVLTDSHFKKKELKSLSAYYLSDKAFEKKRRELKADKDILSKMSLEVQGLKQVSQDFPKTKASIMSLLKVGDFFVKHQKYAEAVVTYTEALGQAKSQFFKVLLYYNLGYAHEFLNQYDEAIANFRKITEFNKTRVVFWSFGERPSTFWLSSAYFGIGRCFEKSKRSSEAKQSYMQIVDEFPNTQFADQAQALVHLVKSTP